MTEVIILAIALSMDAFAVSIGLGVKESVKGNVKESTKKIINKNTALTSLAFKAGLYFGVFQGVMPLIGYLGGKGALSLIEDYANWIAFFLLIFIGAKMIYESFCEGVEKDIAMISHRVMLTLAIATSIDAMAAGFSLTLLDVNVFVACLMIGATTFAFSGAGVFVGYRAQKHSGIWLESRAELLGGAVLILLAFKFLLL